MTTNTLTQKDTNMTTTTQPRDFLEEAKHKIIGYEDHEKERETAKELARSLKTCEADIIARQKEAVATLESARLGGDGPALLAAARAKREAETEGAEYVTAYRDALNATRLLSGGERQRYEASDTAPALTYLNECMTDLMQRVRELPDLGGIETAEDAIRAGDDTARAWRALSQACDDYEAIRKAADHIVTLHTYDTEPLARAKGPWRCYSHLKDAFNKEHYIVTYERRTAGRNADNRLPAVPFNEWLTNPAETKWHRDPGEVWPAGNRLAYLRWLAVGDRAWVPTIEQLERTVGLSQAMLDAAPLERALIAFDAYYADLGAAEEKPVNSDKIRKALADMRRQITVVPW